MCCGRMYSYMKTDSPEYSEVGFVLVITTVVGSLAVALSMSARSEE
jgi:hypothetical protein